MLLNRPILLAICATSLLNACGGGDQDIPDDAPINQTKVIFSPATSQLPVPNDLLFSPPTYTDEAGNETVLPADGTMHAGIDPTNPVIGGIDALDGASVLSPIDIAFDGSLDSSQTLDARSFVVPDGGVVPIPNPNQNVFLLPLSYPSGDGLSQATDANGASVEVPTFAEALAYQTAAATSDLDALAALAEPVARAEIISLDGGSNNVLRINPVKPLQPKTKYLIVITNLDDRYGNSVGSSTAYDTIKDPNSDLSAFGDSAASLLAVRGAIQGWEQLAAGYFGFMQLVYTSSSLELSPPSTDDILLTMTFTTNSPSDVLTYMAAPESFIADSLADGYKKDAISKLVDGTYLLNGDTSSSDPADVNIAGIINAILTTNNNALYQEDIANAIGAGADYATIAADASAAFIMQSAAAAAAIQYHDVVDGTSIADEALGTVQGIAGGVPANDNFPIPAARTTNFYRVDPSNDINPALASPAPGESALATIYQGEITLPYYLATPGDTDFSAVKTSKWEGSATLAGILGATVDIIDPLTGDLLEDVAPPISYRYPFPANKGDVTIPILVTTPNESIPGVDKPAEGWPVIIYAHGITTDRSAALVQATTMASACISNPALTCYATVTIDQPLHGVMPKGSTLSGLVSVSDPDGSIPGGSQVGDNEPSAQLTERHFDLTADAATNPVQVDYAADLETDASGSLFVNLTNFPNARDNLRQMSSDLLNVNASLATMDLDDDGNPDFDTDNVYFMGMSLGAINGLPFVAVNNSDAVQNSSLHDLPFIKVAAGFNTGGSVARLLTNSVSRAPQILAGLAAASDALQQGQSGLETYLSIYQGLADSGDVTNFASLLSDDNSSTGIYLTEIVGDGGSNLPDQTIPNSADSIWGGAPLSMTVPSIGLEIDNFPAPLAGTEPMIAQFDAQPSDDIASMNGDAAVVVSRFVDGSHGTPADAGNESNAEGNTVNIPEHTAVYNEIMAQVLAFFEADGDVTGSIVVDTDLVE